MVQKKEFNQFFKQKILSDQKHKCKKCGLKFNGSNLPEFGYNDGNITNNEKNNIQALCLNCFSKD